MKTVSRTQHTPSSPKPVCETELGRQIVAVTVVGNLIEAVYLDRTRDRLVTQTVLKSEIWKRLPIVARVKLHVPVAKAPADIADGNNVLRGRSEPKVRDCVPAEIVGEGKEAPVRIRLDTVDLPPYKGKTRAPVVTAPQLPHLTRIPEEILRPIDGNASLRTQRFQA